MKTIQINEHPEGKDVNLHSLNQKNVKKIKESLHQLRNFVKESDEGRDKMEEVDLEFSEKVKSMLLGENEGLDASQVLGQRLTTYQSKS
jgi:hypothetical protein